VPRVTSESEIPRQARDDSGDAAIAGEDPRKVAKGLGLQGSWGRGGCRPSHEGRPLQSAKRAVHVFIEVPFVVGACDKVWGEVGFAQKWA
jgi:hypothetical protein